MRYSLTVLFIVLVSSIYAQVEFSYDGQILDQANTHQINISNQVAMDLYIDNLSLDTLSWGVGYCRFNDDPNIEPDVIIFSNDSTQFGIEVPYPFLTFPCWNLQNNFSSIEPGGTAQLRIYFSVIGDGCEEYNIKILEGNGSVDSLNVNFCSGTNSLDELGTNEVLLHPNPATNEVVFHSGVKKAEVFSALGKIVLDVRLDLQKNSADVSDLPNGVYTVLMYSETGELKPQKLVIAH
jgi:hypothetical protein